MSKSAQNNAQDAGPITGNIMKISPRCEFPTKVGLWPYEKSHPLSPSDAYSLRIRGAKRPKTQPAQQPSYVQQGVKHPAIPNNPHFQQGCTPRPYTRWIALGQSCRISVLELGVCVVFSRFSIMPAADPLVMVKKNRKITFILVKPSQIAPIEPSYNFKKKCRTSPVARACITHHP